MSKSPGWVRSITNPFTLSLEELHMKRFITLCAVLAAIVSSSQASDSTGHDARFTEAKLTLIEKSLANALESSSPGLQASAAQTVRDLKKLVPEYSFSRLVIPLMRIVKDEGAEIGPRILAALALHDLRSEMGDFAISRVATFTDVKRMKHLCAWLTYEKLIAQKTGVTADSMKAVAIR